MQIPQKVFIFLIFKWKYIMENKPSLLPQLQTRIGFHYFPDTLHYRDHDLQTWLPELIALGASWLILKSNTTRAIPENFISSLLQVNIEPLIQFDLPFEKPPDGEEIQSMLETYSRWGVRAVTLFDRPNDRSFWLSSDWVQHDLVETFIDYYLPLANFTLETGMLPVFPPLEPGGSYWDTAFLRSSLTSLLRRGESRILDNMVLSAYSWTGGHSLNWGEGGPERWPGAKPYFTPAKEQDQRGFRIYDWYNAISQAVLQKKCPIILFGAGCANDPLKNQSEELTDDQQSDINLSIAKICAGTAVDTKEVLEPLAKEVIGCNFWLLSAEASSPFIKNSWYHNPELPRKIVQEIKSWRSTLSQNQKTDTNTTEQFKSPVQPVAIRQKITPKTGSHPLQHYLLLPRYEWGIADWHLDVIRPFVKKHNPTIGFSQDEAALAQQVTVIGNTDTFSEDLLNKLRAMGCSVDRIDGDGTTIATKLAER
jgi:hypothetical protein